VKKIYSILLFCVIPVYIIAQDTLIRNFQSPPPEAQPRAYWWWLNSQVTKESITRDLEEMKAKGYGGAILFDAGNSANNLVRKPKAGPTFGSKEWTDLFVHTMKEADRLGLEISANIQSGWNLGGPTVKPNDATRRIFWADTIIEGGRVLECTLPKTKAKDPIPVCVQAYPVINEVPKHYRIIAIDASTGIASPDGFKVFDSDSTTYWESHAIPTEEKPEHFQFEFFVPERLNKITITPLPGFEPKDAELMITDGVWSPSSVKKFTFPGNGKPVTVEFPERTFKLVRFVFYNSYSSKIRISSITCNDNKKYSFGLFLYENKALNRQFGTRGGAEPLYLLRQEFIENPSEVSGYSKQVVDLSTNITPDGKLKWNVPAGKWRVVNYVNGMHGAHVSTCSDGWEGLSLDHLSDSAFLRYMNEAFQPILDAAKPYWGKSLKYLYTDSWEMGTPNYTHDFREQFIKRRGYDPLPYMGALTGEIIDSRDISDRFLFDWRKTVADLIAERHYAVFADYAKKRGLDFHPESGGPHGAPIDALRNLGMGAFPMGEFWARSATHRTTDDQRLFVKQFASAAHVYGKQWVAAEGPTSIGPHWERPPRELRDVFNDAFLEGLNRSVWHTFTNSPKEAGIPGNEYFAGTHLNPQTTWWPMAKPWIDYISRCSYMLSRGLFVADLCFYLGDDVPNLARRRVTIDGLGEGFDYDWCNTEVLLTRMSVKDGLILLPDGMSYKILVLPEDTKAITLEVLRKIAQLVNDGATVYGHRFETSNGLTNYPESESEVRGLTQVLLGAIDGINVFENKYGKGKVIYGKLLKELLAGMDVQPDFSYKASMPNSRLGYIHRKDGDADIYFVANRLARHGIYDTKYRYFTNLPDRYEQVDCKFRVTGKIPEIFDPVTGKTYEVPLYRIDGDFTSVPVRITPDGSVFVVFRKPVRNLQGLTEAAVGNRNIFPASLYTPGYWDDLKLYSQSGKYCAEAFTNEPISITTYAEKKITLKPKRVKEFAITGKWEISFPPNWGAPEKTVFDSLKSWTESSDGGIKYFSGIATYHKSIELPSVPMNARVYIDLGNVLEMAEVIVNGVNCGTLWIAPFRADITNAVKKGKNHLEIRVVNMWPNRIIGDLNQPEEKRFTKTNVIKFKKNDPLRPSGLLGPVTIKMTEVMVVD
jgi:hypothetical protein